MTKNSKSKNIVETSILTALIFIFMFLTQIFGLGIITSIIAPIPLIVIYVKHGFKMSILSLLISLILMTLLVGPINALVSVITTGAIGIAFGFGVKNKKTGNMTLFYVFIANLIATIINFTLSLYLISNMTLIGLLQKNVDAYKAQVDTLMKATSDPNTIEAYKNMMASFTVEKILVILPTIILIYVLVSSLISYTAARSVLVKLNYKVNNFDHFTKWYLPPVIIAGFILIAIIGMGLKMNGVNAGKDIFTAVWHALAAFMAIQGLSLAAYFMKAKLKFKMPIVVIICVFLIITIIPITYLIAIGIVDVLLDYRSVDPESLGSYIRRKVNKK